MIWSYAFYRYELCILAIIIFTFSLWLTFYLRFIQVRYFRYAWSILFDKINQHLDLGEISQIQALSLGLSGTIGIANIAIVSAAIIIAGPGSVLWLIISAFLGMSMKFCESTLGQKFRLFINHQIYIGGPMVTLERLLDDSPSKENEVSQFFKKKLIRLVTNVYSISLLIIILIFGNLFQINQLVDIFQTYDDSLFIDIKYLPFLLMFLIISLVWNGKYNRLGYFLARVIPIAFSTYIVFSIAIVLLNFDKLLDVVILIFKDAFFITNHGYENLFIFTIGILLGMISHESGLGVSSIAHASAKARYPVRQGLIAMLEPFIDTMLICLLTALVLLIALDDGFMPSGYSSLNIKLAFVHFIPWFSVWFDIIMTLLTLSCLVSCYFYSGKIIQYIFNFKLSIYTLFFYFLLLYSGTQIYLVDLLPIVVFILPFVVIPNVISILLYAKDLKKDLIAYLTNLDDSFAS